MTPLHRFTKSYWDAFYTGMMAVGLAPGERPAFKAKGHTESETMRCMRVALETLKHPPKEALVVAEAYLRTHHNCSIEYGDVQVMFRRMIDEMFPEPIKPRKATLTANDMAIKDRAKRTFG